MEKTTHIFTWIFSYLNKAETKLCSSTTDHLFSYFTNAQKAGAQHRCTPEKDSLPYHCKDRGTQHSHQPRNCDRKTAHRALYFT